MRSAVLRASPPSMYSTPSAGSLKNTRIDRHIGHDDGPEPVLAVQQHAAGAEGDALVGQPPPAGPHLAGQALDVGLVDGPVVRVALQPAGGHRGRHLHHDVVRLVRG